MKVKRNDPCPCGSGARYKHCCANKARPLSRFTTMALLIGGALTVALVAIAMTMREPQTSGPAPYVAAPAAVPGGAPAGVPAGVPAGGGPGTPQPPGEAPPGKVWSPEHGHWHDIAPGTAPVATPAPTGTAPTGATPAPGGP